MNRERANTFAWVSLLLLIWFLNLGTSAMASTAEFSQPGSSPIECPLGDAEDPDSGKSESENDKETDDDNLYEGRSIVAFSKFRRDKTYCEWDLIHDDPCDNLNSPPPEHSLSLAHS